MTLPVMKALLALDSNTKALVRKCGPGLGTPMFGALSVQKLCLLSRLNRLGSVNKFASDFCRCCSMPDVIGFFVNRHQIGGNPSARPSHLGVFSTVACKETQNAITACVIGIGRHCISYCLNASMSLRHLATALYSTRHGIMLISACQN